MGTFCLRPKCGAVVERGYCPDHTPVDRRRIRDERQGNANTRGYTYRWYRRATLFRQRFPLCGQRAGGRAPVLSVCYEEHRVTIADVVDHVVPHKGNRELFWSEDNWQSLCAACHARKTGLGF